MCYKCGGKGHPARLCPSADDCQDVDEVGTEQSSDADNNVCGLDWCDELDASINSVVSQKTRPSAIESCWRSSMLVRLALSPNTPCNEYPLEKTTSSRSGIGFKGTNGTHIEHHKQRCVRVLSNAGSNMNTTWEVADVRKPLISASRLLEVRHKLVLDEKSRTQCKNGDILALEGCGSLFAVRLWIPEVDMKRKACKITEWV